MRTAETLIHELGGKPFRSVNELLRHAIGTGLIQMAEHGVPVDPLREVFTIEEAADRAWAVLEATKRTQQRCQMLIENAETTLEVETARGFVVQMMAVTKDPEVRDRLEKLLRG